MPPPPSRGGGPPDRPDQEALLCLPSERRSLVVAYLLLFVGGIFGLHWIYLGDHNKYKVYACTLGLCGLGVVMDFLNMPQLVAAANSEPHRLRRSDLEYSDLRTPSGTPSRSNTPQQPVRAQQSHTQAPGAEASSMEEGRVGDAAGGGGARGAPARSADAAGEEEAGMVGARGTRSARGAAAARRIVLSQAAELQYLCDMFSNIEADEVKRTWAEARRDVTRSVELLSAISDAKVMCVCVCVCVCVCECE